jgi:hypothetical protein
MEPTAREFYSLQWRSARLAPRRRSTVGAIELYRKMIKIHVSPAQCFTVCLFTVFVLSAGCGKSAPREAAGPGGEQTGSRMAPADGEVEKVLADLTFAVRKYSVEKRQVPASLTEVAAAGYIQNVPQPPPGKSFAIDQKNVRVFLK